MVFADGDQELAGDVGTDPVRGDQAAADGRHEGVQELVQVGDLDGELLMAAAQ